MAVKALRNALYKFKTYLLTYLTHRHISSIHDTRSTFRYKCYRKPLSFFYIFYYLHDTAPKEDTWHPNWCWHQGAHQCCDGAWYSELQFSLVICYSLGVHTDARSVSHPTLNCGHVRYGYDTRTLRFRYERHTSVVRRWCDKMAVKINFTNQATNSFRTNYRPICASCILVNK